MKGYLNESEDRPGSLAVFWCCLAILVASGTSAADTVKIGLVITFSGPLEFVRSNRGVAGAQFAVDEQNAKGGLLGRKWNSSCATTNSRLMWASKGAKDFILDDKINFLERRRAERTGAVQSGYDLQDDSHQYYCPRRQLAGERFQSIQLQSHSKHVRQHGGPCPCHGFTTLPEILYPQHGLHARQRRGCYLQATTEDPSSRRNYRGRGLSPAREQKTSDLTSIRSSPSKADAVFTIELGALTLQAW